MSLGGVQVQTQENEQRDEMIIITIFAFSMLSSRACIDTGLELILRHLYASTLVAML